MDDNRYHVVVPDVDTYREMVKCQAACPVNTDARGYVTAIHQGDLERGYRIAREPNPLSSMCGRICGAPCEVACRRGDIDEPVAIRPLKRVLTERFGAESQIMLPIVQSQSELGVSADLDESTVAWSRSNLTKLSVTPGRKAGKVAVVGAGPAGLAAAHDLAVLGYEVKIFEAGPKSGGMIRYGVPSYRVDWEMMDREVQEIEDLGVEIIYNTPIGEKISLAQLRQDFDAVFLGVGLMKGRDLNIEGSNNDGVIKAVDLLLNFNLGYKVELGKRVIVIGGGDVAMDAARTALRAGQMTEEQRGEVEGSETRDDEEAEAIHDALDVARTALRMGAGDVKIFSLEDWDELPASEIEIEEAIEEGIEIQTRFGPKAILSANGKVTGIEMVRASSVFDENGRFNPQFVENSEERFEADTVILAIGQQADLALLESNPDIEVTPRGYFITNNDTGQTTASDVFAGGDVAFGPRLLIHAVRDGHNAALGIDEFIQGKKHVKTVSSHWTNMVEHEMPENWIKYQREKVPTMPLDRRTGINQVELGYSIDQAEIQSMRCLECSINTIFDGSKCILCNGCVDVCPWDCLKIVSLSEMAGGERLDQVVEVHTGLSLGAIQAGGNLQMAAMIKDDEACTRCALCADRCPTDAITMESFRFQETLAYGN